MAEFFFATAVIALGAVFWAYTLGTFCAVVSTSDRSAIAFRQVARLRFRLVEGSPPLPSACDGQTWMILVLNQQN